MLVEFTRIEIDFGLATEAHYLMLVKQQLVF